MKPLWTPSPERAAQALLARFMQRAGKKSYAELHRWSVEHGEEFLRALAEAGHNNSRPDDRAQGPPPWASPRGEPITAHFG